MNTWVNDTRKLLVAIRKSKNVVDDEVVRLAEAIEKGLRDCDNCKCVSYEAGDNYFTDSDDCPVHAKSVVQGAIHRR